jgi:hypothetical protein
MPRENQKRYYYLPDESGRLRRVKKALYSSFGAERKSVWFFDDDPKNLKIVSKDPRVRATLVPIVKIDTDNYTEFVRVHGGWDAKRDHDLFEFIEYRRKIGADDDTFGSMGLTFEQMNAVCNWAKKKRGSKATVAFDFDFVLNRLEGIMLQSDASPSGVAKYAVGTSQRLRAIRAMIDCVLKNGGKVFIVTNNGGSEGDMFVRVCNAIHPHFTRDSVKSALPYERNKLVCMYKTGILTPFQKP